MKSDHSIFIIIIIKQTVCLQYVIGSQKRNIGMSAPTGGSILVDSIQSMRKRVCRDGANAMAQAAGTASASAKADDPIDIAREL